MQCCFCETHFYKALPYEDVCGTPIVHQYSPYIIPCEVHWILTDVGPDDERVIVWVVLQPKVCLCEGYRDMRPSCSEAFALADMRNCSEVLLALPLCLKHWFIRPSGDGVDDVHPAARMCIDCSLWNLPRLKFRR